MKTTAIYNAEGQILTLTHGDLTSISDPVGNTSYLFEDGAGRLIWTQDPLGNATNLSYSPLDDLTQITDALGGISVCL